MTGEYRVRTEWDDDLFDGDPDALYHTLDSLSASDGTGVAIRPVGDDGSFAEAVVSEDGSFLVRFKDRDAGPAEEVMGVDILAAHQALMSYARSDGGWAATFRNLEGSFGSVGVTSEVDYRTTGLSIATALIDSTNRRRRLGMRQAVPPTISWGPHTVMTGDLWTGLPVTGRVTIRITSYNGVREGGVAVNAPGGSLRAVGETAGSEVIVWPSPESREFVVEFDSPRGVLGVCNVYVSAGHNWSRIDRWSENAGMTREVHSDYERSYDCNHALSDPPTFRDLSFIMSVEPA
ncbi:hypothetical protein [Micromonospora sp. NPDC093244]|uniref:hypothetical protein n=1 Tax=Micromonospora sp. NPDC093244 TaxID=3155071 RepID=UPI00343A50C1